MAKAPLPFASGDAAQFELPASLDAYLGDPNTVDGLVRAFIAELVADRMSYSAGTLTPDEVEARLDTRAVTLADAFMGKDPAAYTGMPNWNRPEGIGKYLHRKRNMGEGWEDSTKALLLYVALRITNAMVDYEADADDEAAKFAVDAAVEDAVADLLGMPADAEARDGITTAESPVEEF